MIRASKRTKKRRKKIPKLKMHVRLARRKMWNQKLTAASILSVFISLLLWFFGVSLFIHIIGVFVSLVIGLFFPIKKSLDWSQNYIAKSIGLSYQTALEHNEELPYGFQESLAGYIKTVLVRLEPPKFRRWWLPILVVSFGLVLLPVSPFRAAPRALGLPFGETLSPEEAREQQQRTEQAQETRTEEEDNPDGADAKEVVSQETNNPQTLEDTAGASGQSLTDLSENVADEEALSRFLDNLSEREIPPEQESQENQPNMQPSSADGSQEDATPQAEGAENSQSSSNSSEGSNEEPQNGSGEEQAEQNESQGEGQGEDEGSDSSAETGDSDETQSDQEGASSTGEQADTNGPTENSSDESVDQGSDGAGENASVSQVTTGLEEDAPTDDPEFLQGELSQGESNLAGTVRLPGASQETFDPARLSSTDFQRAQEQAVTEGRIPIEYQEIIRNYFR